MNKPSNKPLLDSNEGRVIYVLILVVLVQSIYPITANGSMTSLIIYQLIYSLLIISGIIVTYHRPRFMWTLIVLGVAWFITGTVFAFNQDAFWANVLGYLVIMTFQATVTWALLSYIFSMKTVTRDVIFASAAVYWLIGAVFIPTYGLIETLTYHFMGASAFVDSAFASAGPVQWQSFVYYSYVTLSTLGYGDVLHVTMLARSVVTLEAMIGVLYTTIIVARLVGLYSAEAIEDDIRERNESE